MKLSLARLFLGTFILLELALSLTIWSGYRQEAAKLHAQGLASENPLAAAKTRILELTSDLQRTAAQIAAHPQTLQALATHTDSERLNQIANIRAFFPDTEVRLLPADNLQAAQGSAPLPAVQARLLAESTKSPVAGTLTAARTTLTAIHPVRDSQRTVYGYVVTEREFPQLQNVLKSSTFGEGYMELRQAGAAGAYTVLARYGDESHKTYSPQIMESLPNTPWQLASWNGALSAVAKLKQDHLFTWLASSLLAAAFCTILYLLLRRTLQGDLQAMLSMFDDIRHNRLRKSYEIQLKDIHTTFDLMYGLGKLMVGKQKEVASQVSLDHLSQVHNRRSFEAKQKELFKSLSQGWVHSLLILDIDNFKQVNDTFGHDAGDTLIVQFGKALKDNLRSSDFIARLGGDEFCVIFPNTPLKRAAELSDRLRKNMPNHVELAGGVLHRLHWSGGLSEYNRHDTSENMALARADGALLEAKRGGRNRTALKAAA